MEFPNFWLADAAPTEEEHQLWLSGEPFILLPPDTVLEVLGREAGIFKSASLARSNGLCGPVPHGVECWGTKKTRFFTIRPRTDQEIESDTWVLDIKATPGFHYTERAFPTKLADKSATSVQPGGSSTIQAEN